MAYQVLLVDDEMPALHLLQKLIEKYAPDFHIAQMSTSTEATLAYLREHPVDVLMTDISMPRMNGIELAMAARSIRPDLHIVIISGYAEFEYAQGAIQASVDDYILKPMNSAQTKRVMDKLRSVIQEERNARVASLLPALAGGLPYSRSLLEQCFGGTTWRFAVVHWGGIDPRMASTLRGTSLILPAAAECYALRGRCEEERVLIFPAEELAGFLSSISVYMTQRVGFTTWTVIYQPQPQPMVALDLFLSQAIPMLQRSSILGKRQILPLALPTGSEDIPSALSVSDLNQLQFYCSTGRYPPIRDLLMELAAGMEANAVPELQVFRITEQILLQFAGSLSLMKRDYQSVKKSIEDLFIYSSSYSELMGSLYGLLFENEISPRNRKLSTRELYDSAVRYIERNYAQPLSVQSVCDELGISPTYLSRLFRKYGDTTFNTFLMKQRMEAAIALLSDKPDMLLRDVASCVGYEDSSYFAKVFYQYTGKRPSQYTQ